MEEIGYSVERDIEPVEFSKSYVENRREEIRAELAREGKTITDKVVEQKVKEELEDVASNMTLEAQGHNDLHRDIEIGSAERE